MNEAVINKRCKFCGVPEGAMCRSGAAAHINRDGLCNSCYQLLRAIKEGRPCSLSDKLWFNHMCELNITIGRFVPVTQRRQLRAKRAWQCHRCGSFKEFDKDEHYKNYGSACATAIRHNRLLPSKADKKQRSDKDSKHRRTKYGILIVDTETGGGKDAN